MSAPFSPRSNTVARVSTVLAVGLVAFIAAWLVVYPRTPYATGLDDQPVQPIDFDHRHHVGDLGIDCLYCHTGAEDSPYAGVPPTSTCMNCHAQVWNRSPMTGEVRQRYFLDRPIHWVRVNNLPDFVFFDHSIHVNKGVGCVTCHGRVDTMPTISQRADMTMAFCIDCHRNPAPRLRPKEEVTNMTWVANEDRQVLGEKLMKLYDVKTRTSCTTCHR